MLQDIKHQLERIKRGNIQSVTYQKKSSQTTWASSDKNKFDQATGYWNKNHKSLHRTRNTKTLQLNKEIQKNPEQFPAMSDSRSACNIFGNTGLQSKDNVANR